MVTLANTTYYPSILLRKRWLECGAGRGGTFDVNAELARLQAESPLNSPEVSALERWSTGFEAAQAHRLDLAPTAYESRSALPASLPDANVRTPRPAVRRRRQPASSRRGSHGGRHGSLALARKVAV